MGHAVETANHVDRMDDLLIPVGDDTVAATRYRPVGIAQPLPALLMYVPYHKDDFITYGSYAPICRYLARHGYEVVVADMVGTGASSGEIDEMFRRREGKEAAEIVEWLADQSWTTGRIGAFGKSYGGITALDAAAQRPESLEAIVPIQTPYLGYRNGYTNTGLPDLFGLLQYWLTMMQVLDVKPPSRRDSDGRWARVWMDRLDTVRDRTPWLVQFLRHRFKGDYWADKDIPVDRINVPTLAVGGWRDLYTQDTVEYFQAIDAKKRLLFGPWRHTMPHRGRESAIRFRQQVVDWFDYFLKDADNSALNGPQVVYWTERDGGGKVDGGVWRGRMDWPAIGTAGASPGRTVPFALTPTGLVHPDEFTAGTVARKYEFDATVGLEATDPFGAGLAPQDTSDDDARSLTFDTAPLDTPIELTGTGSAHLRLTPNTDEFTLSLRIVDVDPDGSGTLVTHGTTRASCHESIETPSPLQPNVEHGIDVPLQPMSHVFERGHRIRVAVAAAFFPSTMPVGDHGSFEVRSTPTDPSTIRFPGGYCDPDSIQNTVSMDDPDDVVPATPQAITDESVSWTTTRTPGRDTARATMEGRLDLELPHVNITRTDSFMSSITADNPQSFRSENTQRFELEYPDDLVTIEASNQFSRELVQLRTVVTWNGKELFDETWREPLGGESFD